MNYSDIKYNIMLYDRGYLGGAEQMVDIDKRLDYRGYCSDPGQVGESAQYGILYRLF